MNTILMNNNNYKITRPPLHDTNYDNKYTNVNIKTYVVLCGFVKWHFTICSCKLYFLE